MNSYWLDSYKNNYSFKSLDKDISTDVCIVGGGIFGITCAYYLTHKGFDVTLLDRDNIAQKVSAHTTAKITSQHGLIYKYLLDSFGLNQTKQYLSANEQAIKNIRKIIDEEKIDCDFEIQDNYVYTTKQNEISKIQEEYKALNSLGFKCDLLTSTPLPFETLSAIKFSNQAQFHPLKYIFGLVDKIIKNSGKIYTHSAVYDINQTDNGFTTYTSNNKVNSKYVILASHYPFINAPGYYFLKMYQSTSYVIAVDTHEKLFDGMYVNIESPIFSFKTVPYKNKRLLFVGGADHKTGSKIDLSDSYNILENEVKKFYPNSEVLYKWNTEDCISLDKIPYIGEFSNLMPNMYIGTGFNKWGMTTSNVAANIIVDKILGKENPYEDVFKSTRFHPIKNSEELGNMVKESVNSIILNKFKIPEKDLDVIKNNTGAVLEYENEKLGVYRNENGKFFAIKPICTHLGCLLSWNNIDKTWDCPCHGSRFDYTGKSIYAPGIKDLEKFEIES